jgi:hypothetical protein
MTALRIELTGDKSNNSVSLSVKNFDFGVNGFELALSGIQATGPIGIFNLPSASWFSTSGFESQSLKVAALDFTLTGAPVPASGLILGQIIVSGWNTFAPVKLDYLTLIANDKSNTNSTTLNPNLNYDVNITGNLGFKLLDTEGSNNYYGGTGTDTVIFNGKKTAYSINSISSMTFKVIKSGVTDVLKDIDRLSFSDVSTAYDLNSNAGIAAKIIGSVFGKVSLTNKNYVGIGVYFLDAGWSYENLASLALQSAGALTNDQIVTLLWNNVLGTKPTDINKAPYLNLLNNGMTPGQLVQLAADSTYNIANIDLVGLSQSGIDYIPVT